MILLRNTPEVRQRLYMSNGPNGPPIQCIVDCVWDQGRAVGVSIVGDTTDVKRVFRQVVHGSSGESSYNNGRYTLYRTGTVEDEREVNALRSNKAPTKEERQHIYTRIDEERARQDTSHWNDNRLQYRYIAPHIILLEEQVATLRSEWYRTTEEHDLKARLVKVAAIAVRALEEIG